VANKDIERTGVAGGDVKYDLRFWPSALEHCQAQEVVGCVSSEDDSPQITGASS
jgi:hypothetical protein